MGRLEEFGFKLEDFERHLKSLKELVQVCQRCRGSGKTTLTREEIERRRIVLGGLFFCNRCYNVHHCGPCMDLGINPTEWAKNQKEWKRKRDREIQEAMKEIVECPNCDGQGKILIPFGQRKQTIGGLSFCNKCYNVHRPGPCQDMGIGPTRWARSEKERQGIK